MTPIQKATLAAYLKTGTFSGAGKLLGKSRHTVRECIRRLEALGEVPYRSAAPQPEGVAVPKTTVQFDGAGNVVQEWRRQTPNQDAQDEFVESLIEKAKGKLKLPAFPNRKKSGKRNTLYEIDIYDPHLGLYAAEKETLDKNYDTKIAADRMLSAVDELASRANNPEKVCLVFGGDMLHSENRLNQTSESGHALDVDSRLKRNISYLVATCREAVLIASKIASKVTVIPVAGNHDYHALQWLPEVLKAAYENEPRIEVINTPTARKSLVYGNNLLAWAHGDKIAASKWAQIIAAEFPKQWGATIYRHVKLGHIHHKKTVAPVIVDEQSGCLVEYLEALTATDAWHSAKGFVGNQKGASAFEYDKEAGLRTRHFFTV